MYVSKLSFSQTTYRPIGNSVHSEVEATLTMFLPGLLVISPGMEVIDLPQRASQSHFSFEGSLVDPRLRGILTHPPWTRRLPKRAHSDRARSASRRTTRFPSL